MDETAELTKNSDGSYTFFCWGAGKVSPMHEGDYSTPFAVPGMRNRPTRNITLKISQQGINIKLYNDVQCVTEFYEQTGDAFRDGSAKKPKDPFAADYKCTTGTRQKKVVFQLEQNMYECPAKLTCQHSSKRLVVTQSSQRYNPNTRRFDVGGGDPGGSSDFLSPWKFMHTQTCYISFDEMSKSVGVSRNELFKKIMSGGLPMLFGVDGYYLFGGDEDVNAFFSDVIVFALAKMNGYDRGKLQILRQEEVELEKQTRAMKRAKYEESMSQLYQKGVEYYNEARASRKKDDVRSLQSSFQAMKIFSTLQSDSTIAECDSSFVYYLRSLQIHIYASYELSIDSVKYRPIFEKDYQFVAESNLSPALKGSIYQGLGIISNRHKLYAEANEQFGESLRLIEKSNDKNLISKCLARRIENYIDGKKYNEALEEIQLALKSYPQEMIYLDLKGRALLGNENKKEAIKVWKKEILAKDPNYASQNSIFYQLLVQHGLIK